MDDQRTSILGSEIARRGRFGLPEPVLAAYGATAVLVLLSYFILGQNWWTFVFIALVILGVGGATWNQPGSDSWADRQAKKVRNRRRRRDGEHIYINPTDPEWGTAGRDPGWELPCPLGIVERVDVAGTGLDDLFILDHRPPGDNDYFSVVLSVQGLAEGLRGDPEWATASSQFGATLANFARRGSFIGGIGMVHRSVPADLNPHEQWIFEQVENNPRAGEVIPAVQAYGDLIDTIRPHVEEHRAYCVLVFPKSKELLDEAARVAKRKQAEFRGGLAQVIRDETMRAVDALQTARMGAIDVLGEQRACAVFRAFLDPSFPLDDHKGLSLENCFPSYVGGDETVQINGSEQTWHTRVATVHPASIQPAPLGPLWHAPLLTGVDPDMGDDEVPPSPTIRTVAVRMDFVEAAQARTDAKRHVTQDAAKRIREDQQGKVTDGTSEIMESASARRREDLMPGTGHHGAVWTMSIAVTGRDEDDVLRACMRVDSAADQSFIEGMNWQDERHDVAMWTTLPLGRGLAATKATRV